MEGNLIIENHFGVVFIYTENVAVYRNSFINNTRQADLYKSNACWSSRWNVTGNYWSDYGGTSWNNYCIGITPYNVSGVYDQNPLMSPYLPGDVYHDGVVDIRDIAIISKAYGSSPGTDEWDAHADLNEDAVVDIKDISIANANYGKTWQAYWGL